MTAGVLFHRDMVVESTVPVSADLKHVVAEYITDVLQREDLLKEGNLQEQSLTNMNKRSILNASDSIQAVDRDGSSTISNELSIRCMSYIDYLSNLEVKIKNNLQIPSFECLNKGTFLNYFKDNFQLELLELYSKICNQSTEKYGIINYISNNYNQKENNMLSTNEVEDISKLIINELNDIWLSGIKYDFISEIYLIEEKILLNHNIKLFHNISKGISFLNFLSNVCNEQYILGHEGLKLKDMLCKEYHRISQLNHHGNNTPIVPSYDSHYDTEKPAKIQKTEDLIDIENNSNEISMEKVSEYLNSISASSFGIPSLAIMEYAVAKHFSDVTITFDTIDTMQESMSEFLQQAYNMNEFLSTHFSNIIKEKYIREGVIQSDNERFHLTGQINEEARNGLLLFYTASSGDALYPIVDNNDNNNNHNNATRLDMYNLELRDRARRLLIQVPYGRSCSKYCCWDGCFRHQLLPGFSVSILDFILEDNIWLSANRTDVYYLATSHVDCIAIPRKSPGIEAIRTAVDGDKFELLSSWCVSSKIDIINSDMFVAILRLYFAETFETSGNEWSVKLLMLSLRCCLSLNFPSYQSIILQMMLDSYAYVSRVTYETAQNNLIELFQYDEKLSDQYLIPILEIASLQPADFPILYSFCNLYGTSAFDKQFHKKFNNSNDDDVNNAPTCVSESDKSLVSHQRDAGRLAREAFHDESSAAMDVATDDIVVYNAYNSISTTVQDKIHNVDLMSNDPRTVIKNLLMKDFSYNADGTRPQENSADRIKLQNALEHLSLSLYSSDVHFVLELIQNADDNEYADGVKPTLKLQLYNHAILVFNNEKGFQENNIIAVCNVGGSTKKGRKGYIGQKGIGYVYYINNKS